MKNFKNQDLKADYKGKIEGRDLAIEKCEDSNLDNPYAIDVEDWSYFYSNKEDRDFDYDLLTGKSQKYYVNFESVHLEKVEVVATSKAEARDKATRLLFEGDYFDDEEARTIDNYHELSSEFHSICDDDHDEDLWTPEDTEEYHNL